MLGWALDEQDGHEHMPDEYKRTIYYCIAEDLILSTTDNTRSPHTLGPTTELTSVGMDKRTNNNFPTCNVDQLLKPSCILLVRIFQ